MDNQYEYHEHCKTMAFVAGWHFNPQEVVFYHDYNKCHFLVNERVIDIRPNSMWAVIRRDIEVNLKK